ncbi:CAP domain-containing protein [Corynebacterium pilbarense]
MPQLDMRQIQQGLAALVTVITLISAIAGLGNQLGVESSSGSSSPFGSRTVEVSQQELIDATNRFRADHGLPALKPLPEMNAFAQEWSETMARTGNFEHRSPLKMPEQPNLVMGENILQNSPSATADAMVQQWANSPGHRANMLHTRYTHIGVGIADKGGKRYATQNFGYYF